MPWNIVGFSTLNIVVCLGICEVVREGFVERVREKRERNKDRQIVSETD